jgi:predicted RNA binding protein YcfA (HicA-like mRNA interferase family)
MSAGMHKRLRALRDLGARYGYTGMEFRGSGHIAMIHPFAGRVIVSASPSDERAMRNVERDMVRQVAKSKGKAS